MTDQQTIRAMLTRAKIKSKISSWDEDTAVKIEGGYPGFYTLLIFHTDGSLKAVEAYE